MSIVRDFIMEETRLVHFFYRIVRLVSMNNVPCIFSLVNCEVMITRPRQVSHSRSFRGFVV